MSSARDDIRSAAPVADATSVSRTYRAPAVVSGIRAHAPQLALIVLFAAVLVLPRWWVLVTEPDEGVRVALSPYGAARIGYDESLYSATTRDIFDGNLPVSGPYLVNHKDDAPDTNTLPMYLVAGVGRATGDIFEGMAIVTTLALLAALVLLYALAYQITGSRWASLAVVPIALMAVQVFNQADGFLPLRHADVIEPVATVDPERELHAWTRFPAPVMVLAPFLLTIIALPRAVESGSRGWTFAAAAGIALMVYGYLFYWTAAGLAAALWLGWMLWRRDYVSARRLAVVGVLALLLSVPELVVDAWNAVALPEDARERVGLQPLGIDTSLAMTVFQRLVVFAGLALLALRHAANERTRLYMCMALAPLILAPTTGLVPQPWHYQTQVWGVFVIPLAIAGFAGAFASIDREQTQVLRAAGAAIAVVAVIGSVHFATYQSRALAQTDEAFAVNEDENAAFDWIDANVSDDETVVSSSVTTNLLLASLTASSQYIAEGGFTTAKDEELIDRLLRMHAAYGYDVDAVLGRFSVDNPSSGFPVTENEGSAEGLERDLEGFLGFFALSFEVEDAEEFEARTESWREPYLALLGEGGVLAEYPADYMYCGPRERYFEAGEPAPGTFVTVAFEQGDVQVYEIVGERAGTEFTGC
jgi:hypothetical protein